MKKLLTSLATFVLVNGSIANAAAFTNLHAKSKAPQPLKANPTLNGSATSVSPYDIAKKLFHKTIKLDPNVWLGKNLATERSVLNAAIVKQGILTADEVQYVTWNSLQIKAADWYWNEGFTVKKDGATAIGNVAINATTGETPAQIAAKLSKATLNFNYDWWKGKDIAANWAELHQMIVNQHILTKAELSDVVGVAYGDDTIVNPYQIILLGLDVNDNNTVSNATPNVNVANDGRSANEIANTISGGTFYLHGNMQGQYADSTAVTQNFRNYLVNDSQLFTQSFTQAEANTVSLPHVKLQSDNNNLTANIVKDGQTATSKINIDAHNYPEILTQDQTNSNFEAVVNLPPQIVSGLKQYFSNPGKTATDKLECFYNTLDDDLMRRHDYVGSIQYFKWGDHLEALLGSYGWTMIKIRQTVSIQGHTKDSGNKKFEEALANKLANTQNPSWLTVYFHWYYAWNTGGGVADVNTTDSWDFW